MSHHSFIIARQLCYTCVNFLLSGLVYFDIFGGIFKISFRWQIIDNGIVITSSCCKSDLLLKYTSKGPLVFKLPIVIFKAIIRSYHNSNFTIIGSFSDRFFMEGAYLNKFLILSNTKQRKHRLFPKKLPRAIKR